MRRSFLVLSCIVLAACGGSSSGSDDIPITDAGTLDGGDTTAPIDADPRDSATDGGFDGATDGAIDGGGDATADAAHDGSDGSDGDGGCSDCIGASVVWGVVGGSIGFSDVSSISPCRTYDHKRLAKFDAGPEPACSRDLPQCGAGDTANIGDVERALADPDVVAALAKAPVTYGRFIPDVGHFQIDAGGRNISIGGDCGGASGCTPPPPGVKALETFLKNLDSTELAAAPCAGKF